MAYDKKAKKAKKDDTSEEYRDWMQELAEFQESDLDQRDIARESDRFLLEEDGQWEDHNIICSVKGNNVAIVKDSCHRRPC